MASPNHHQQRQLIPGFPNDLTLCCLLPRIPWHTRPRMRSVSKAWKEALDHNLAAYAALTRRDSDVRDGLVMLHQISEEEAKEWYGPLRFQGKWMPTPHALSIYDDESERWRLLPPILTLRHPMRVPNDCGIACVDRKLFVMGGWDHKNEKVSAQVYMLDLGSGLWQWERRSNMCVPKASFECTSVAGKIYVLGGFSTSRLEENSEQLAPMAYHVDRDHWSLLPQVVNTQQSFQPRGLAAAGEEVIAFGYNSCYIPSTRWKVYDPVAKLWSDWDYDHTDGSASAWGYYKVHNGIVHKVDNSSRLLRTTFNGKVSIKGWGWSGEEIWVHDSSEGHGYLFVKEDSKPHVYAIIGDYREPTLWRGDMDNELKTVAWRNVELPSNNLYMSGKMCYFH